MAAELFCVSKNGKHVYYDSVSSNASTHFADTPGLEKLVREVLESKDIDDSNLGFTVDMGRIIGTTDVVEIDSSDEIVYVIRKNRLQQGYVPFTKSRETQPDTCVSVSLVANPDRTYQLSSAWIGTWDDPPFPQEPHATPDSKSYWDKHAFVWGSQEIEPGSEITTKPW